MELNSPFVKGISVIVIQSIFYDDEIELLDKDKILVFLNDSLPVMNDCRLGRFENVK